MNTEPDIFTSVTNLRAPLRTPAIPTPPTVHAPFWTGLPPVPRPTRYERPTLMERLNGFVDSRKGQVLSVLTSLSVGSVGFVALVTR